MSGREKDALRYLGYKGRVADETVMSLIDSCFKELDAAVNPKSVWREYPAVFEDGTLKIESLEIKSASLEKHLKGCCGVILFAATLGAPADFLIRKYSGAGMSRAAVLDACAAAMIEEYCDLKQAEISGAAAQRGLFPRPRYSPGYGDFSLSHQREILTLLDCPKRIGLSMTSGLMLVPSKSVTAVIGLGPKTQMGAGRCGICKDGGCPYKEESL